MALDGAEAEEFKKVTCPDCREEFTPQVIERVKPPTPEEKAAAEAKEKQEALVARIEDTRMKASIFKWVAVASVVLSVLVFIFYVLNSSDPSAISIKLMAGDCLGSAAWCYLIAQLLHIRANTAEIAAQRK